MPPKEEKVKNEAIKEDEPDQEAQKAKAEVTKKIEEKKEEIKEAQGGKPVNVIGEIEKPDDDAPASEWKEWGTACMAKLDMILERLAPPKKEEPPKKIPWHEKDLF